MKFRGIHFFVQHHGSNSSVWTSFSLDWDSHLCRLATRVTSEHRCYGYLLLTGYHCTLRNTTEGPGNTYPKLTNNMMSANYLLIQNKRYILFIFFFLMQKLWPALHTASPLVSLAMSWVEVCGISLTQVGMDWKGPAYLITTVQAAEGQTMQEGV